MRVLFSSTWGTGHIFPMLPLSRALVEAGHEVAWATSADSCARVTGAGFEARPAGLSGPGLREVVHGLNASSRALPPDQRAAFIYPRMFGATFTPPMLADLLPLARQWRPDLLIHEHGELAAPLVGALVGVPSVTHSFGGGIPASFVAGAGECLEPLWSEHGLAIPPYAGCFTGLYLDICPTAVQAVDLSHIAAVQPLRPVQYIGDPPGELPAFLVDDGRPLVYLTLGTVFNDGEIIRRVTLALSDLPVRLLVSLGPAGDPAAPDPHLPNVRVETWVHQPQVLEHSRVVVSHAGSGTFLGALALGIPQLCIPQGADQFRNAEGGVRSGAALALAPADATPATIAEAVTRLLEDGGFRERAEAVADEIRAMPSPADIVETLVELTA